MTKLSRPSFPFALLLFWLWRILLMWLLIGFIIFILQILFCAMCHNNERIDAMLSVLKVLPPFLKKSIGGEMLQKGIISNFIAIGYIHPLVMLLYLIFIVSVPTDLLTGHVQSGYMELILSRAVTKTQVYICTLILTFAGMLALFTVMFLGTVVGTTIYDFGQQVTLYPFFRAAVNGVFLAGACTGISLLSAASFRSRGWAVGAAAAYLIACYIVNLFEDLGPVIRILEPLSLFYYIDTQKIMSASAWPVKDMAILAAVMIITTAAGGIIWKKRDLPL